MFDFVRNVEIWEDGRLVLLESFQSQDKLVGGVAEITLQIYWSPVTIIHTSQCVILKYLDIFLNPWQGRNKNDVHWDWFWCCSYEFVEIRYHAKCLLRNLMQNHFLVHFRTDHSDTKMHYLLSTVQFDLWLSSILRIFIF